MARKVPKKYNVIPRREKLNYVSVALPPRVHAAVKQRSEETGISVHRLIKNAIVEEFGYAGVPEPFIDIEPDTEVIHRSDPIELPQPVITQMPASYSFSFTVDATSGVTSGATSCDPQKVPQIAAPVEPKEIKHSPSPELGRLLMSLFKS
jgi:hypothetical protein